ncbi:hypothetical protein ACIF85_08890 [Streptomyces sp. NPDC086033]|uniref:hypothetical protein n=1 Tax=Streptomyces sp. NPDC086033 TaxID=3365747 RepID=UPI0037D8C27A
MTDTLRPVLEERLTEMTDSLATAIADTHGSDAVDALRAELLRRVLPQFTEAVRGAVIEGIRTRQMHLAQLAVIDRSAHQATKLTSLRARIDNEITRAGLVRVTEPQDLSLFDLVNPDSLRQGVGEPPVYSVLAPAYTDRESGKLVERGWLSVSYERPAPAKPALTPGQKRRQHGRRPEKQGPASEKRAADSPSAQLPTAKRSKGAAPDRQPESAPPPLADTAHLHDSSGSSAATSKRSRRTDPPVRDGKARHTAEPVREPESARSREPVQGHGVARGAEGVGRRPTAAPGTTASDPQSAGIDQSLQPAPASKIDLRKTLRAAASRQQRQGGSR